MIKHKDNPISIRSKKWFVASLLQLMQEKPFEKITISEIAKRADLDRSTFYRNFDSKEDLLRLYIDDIAKEYVNRLVRIENINMNKVADIFLSLMQEHEIFIVTLKKHGLSNLLLDSFNTYLPQIHEITKEQFPQSISDDVLHYALAYNAGGMWNMLMLWIDKQQTNSYKDLLKAFKEISSFNMSQIKRS